MAVAILVFSRKATRAALPFAVVNSSCSLRIGVSNSDAINQAQAFQKVGLDLIDFLFRPSNCLYRLNSYSIG
jgi:hypothetical protein